MHSARFLLIFAFATGIASAQTCDRACLKTTLDQYLNAVVKHDTSAAQDTASRDIQALIEADILVKDAAGGRSTSYSLRESSKTH
jgi:hypothetical protein